MNNSNAPIDREVEGVRQTTVSRTVQLSFWPRGICTVRRSGFLPLAG